MVCINWNFSNENGPLYVIQGALIFRVGNVSMLT